MVRLTIKPRAEVSKKHGPLAKANNTNKHAKKKLKYQFFILFFGPVSIAGKKFS